ncbi:MAG: hypothetical protein U0667_12985 [Chloroflexota bacterium]
MNGVVRRCVVMAIGAFALAAVLLAAGVPGAVLLGFAPLAVCLGMHLLMVHGDPHGQHLLATARRAGEPHDRDAEAAPGTGASR